MVVVYPFPMHLSQGFSYMLSIAQFVNGLAKYCQVDLLCLDSGNAMSKFYRETLSEPVASTLKIVQLNNHCCGFRSNRLFFQAKVRRHISRLLSEGENVVVYSRDYKQMTGLISADWKGARPYFVFESHQIQSQNLCRNGDFSSATKLRNLEKKVYREVDAIAPITQTLSNEISRVFPEVTDHRIVLPVGVSERFFICDNARKNYDLIYSGNFSRWKGIDTLVKSVHIVKKKFPEVRVLLVGIHDSQESYYQDMISKLDLLENVELRPRVPIAEIPMLLAQSRVGLLPVSYQEDGLLYTSPLKLCEYLASGLVVVASQVPSLMAALPENLVYWALPDNADSFARSINQALECGCHDPSEGVEYAKEFTWKKRGERLHKFLSIELARLARG